MKFEELLRALNTSDYELTELKLDDSLQEYTVSAVSTAQLNQALATNTTLQRIVVIGSELHISAKEARPDALLDDLLSRIFSYVNRVSNVRELTVRDCKLTSSRLNQLCLVLNTNRTLVHLALNGETLTTRDLYHLVTLLTPHPVLETLNLDGCRFLLGIPAPMASAQHAVVGRIFADYLTTNKTLRTLSLRELQLEPIDITNLADALRNNVTLRTLLLDSRLNRQPRHKDAMKVFSAMLPYNDSLQTLTLGDDDAKLQPQLAVNQFITGLMSKNQQFFLICEAQFLQQAPARGVLPQAQQQSLRAYLANLSNTFQALDTEQPKYEPKNLYLPKFQNAKRQLAKEYTKLILSTARQQIPLMQFVALALYLSPFDKDLLALVLKCLDDHAHTFTDELKQTAQFLSTLIVAASVDAGDFSSYAMPTQKIVIKHLGQLRKQTSVAEKNSVARDEINTLVEYLEENANHNRPINLNDHELVIAYQTYVKETVEQVLQHGKRLFGEQTQRVLMWPSASRAVSTSMLPALASAPLQFFTTAPATEQTNDYTFNDLAVRLKMLKKKNDVTFNLERDKVGDRHQLNIAITSMRLQVPLAEKNDSENLGVRGAQERYALLLNLVSVLPHCFEEKTINADASTLTLLTKDVSAFMKVINIFCDPDCLQKGEDSLSKLLSPPSN